MQTQSTGEEPGKAILVKVLTGFRGSARLYKLDPPLEGHEFVVSSAVVAYSSGPETYLFPSNRKGDVTSWGELPGSMRGTLVHDEALRAAGYEVTL